MSVFSGLMISWHATVSRAGPLASRFDYPINHEHLLPNPVRLLGVSRSRHWWIVGMDLGANCDVRLTHRHFVRQSVCKNGHRYVPGSYTLQPGHGRVCLICKRNASRRRKATQYGSPIKGEFKLVGGRLGLKITRDGKVTLSRPLTSRERAILDSLDEATPHADDAGSSLRIARG